MVDLKENKIAEIKKESSQQESSLGTKENIEVVENNLGGDKHDNVTKDKEHSEALSVAVASTQSIAPVKNPILVDLEDLLSEDLTDLYLGLPDVQKFVFKESGEKLAEKINIMIVSGKIRAKKILDLIRDWLKVIPGVNKFFLEQEVKIKADKILKYAEEQVHTKINKI